MANILVIDDESLFRDLLSQVLGGSSHAVTTAEDGTQGIEAAKQTSPDLVITDMSMPGGVSGWDVIRALKNEPATSAIKIIALTAHATNEDRVEGYEAGCDAYVAKPLDMPLLLKQIESLLG
jgi:two-component system, cell cycle response regulator DivK